ILYSLGAFSSSIYAAIVVIGLTLINVVGIHVGTGIQKMLVSLQFIGLLALIAAGFFFHADGHDQPAVATVSSGITPAIGGAMVMVLLTFGGWNEVGYISSEMRDGSKKMAMVMIIRDRKSVV